MNDPLHVATEQLAALAAGRGAPQHAERLRAELARDSGGEATVVIAGETKRGKSSLVNALLGRDVSPVDAAVATSAYLVIRGGSSNVARAHRFDGSTEELPVSELASWAAVGGKRAKGVQRVELELDSPLLASGLTLIDTPGVGGLEASHAEVTHAALVHGDALIFVVDADAPLSRPELDFLANITTRIDTVLFALTKIDKFGGWQVVLEDDRALLRERAPRFADAPFLALSSVLKRDADAAADGGDRAWATELEADSGFAALLHGLEERVVGRARQLRRRNLAALGSDVIASLRLPDRAQQAQEDPALLQAIRDTEERLALFKGPKAGWRAILARRFDGLRLSLDQAYKGGLLSLEEKYEREIAAWRKDLLETLEQQLLEDVNALAARLDRTFSEGVADLLEELARSLALDAKDISAPGSRGPRGGRIPTLSLVVESPGGSRSKARDLQVYLGGAFAGSRLGVLGGMLGISLGGAALVVGAAGAGAGLVLAHFLSRHINTRADQVEGQALARRAVQQTVKIAAVEVHGKVQEQLLDLRHDLADGVTQRVDERINELEAAKQAAIERRHQGQVERTKSHAAARSRLRELHELEERLHDALEASIPAIPVLGQTPGR